MKLLIDYGGTFFRSKCCGEYEKLESKNINLIKFIEDKIKRYGIRRVGISFAGQINNGVILSSPNIKGLDGFDIKGYFFKKYGAEIFIENDLKCAATAEKDYFKSDYIAVIYIGTGLGGAFIEKDLIRGYRNLAGELGHIPYKKTPFVCGCGKNNCLELTCSGKAMTLRGFKDLSGNDFKKEFNKSLNYVIEVVSVMLNPEIIVLGGGVVEHNKININPCLPSFTKVRVEISATKNAALKGVELLMQSEVENGKEC